MLLSNGSFRQAQKFGSTTNHDLTKHEFQTLLGYRRKHPIWLFGAIVRGEQGIFSRLGTKEACQSVRRRARQGVSVCLQGQPVQVR